MLLRLAAPCSSSRRDDTAEGETASGRSFGLWASSAKEPPYRPSRLGAAKIDKISYAFDLLWCDGVTSASYRKSTGSQPFGRGREIAAVRRSVDTIRRLELSWSQFYPNSLSSVIGRSRTRIPVALYTAFATAAAVPVIPISPTPRAPMGVCGSGMSVHITSISGTSM